ncbi:MAG TPA: SRPBCC domain-containing protein [Kofleriaceae bacterium]|nr:SRPBCC domain-containing protein [Kofleriaceae bacterium]
MQAPDQAVVEALDMSADIATVWRAWTDPGWLAGWLVERADGAITPGESVAWRWDSLGLELGLIVVDVDPPRRLSLRGGAPGRPSQLQTVTLSEAAAGGTRVELTHGGFAPGPAGEAERAGSAAGWRVMLRVLAHYLAGRAGRPREVVSAIAPVAAPLAAIGPLLHDPVRRADWLTGGGAATALAREGEPFALALRGAAPCAAGGTAYAPSAADLAVSGRVIALAPPFELALGWDEVDGVLILRAIQVAAGPGAPVLACAQAWSWAPERAAWASARAALEAALARLLRAAGGGAAGSA